MKAILRALLHSLVVYGFFILFYSFILFGKMTELSKTSSLSVSQLWAQFWQGYQWWLIVPHALYLFVFLAVQARIHWIGQHPSLSLTDQQLQQKQRVVDFLMRWVAGPIHLLCFVILTGFAFLFSRMEIDRAFPIALFFLYLLLAASGLNILSQNYLHYLRRRRAETVEEVLAKGTAPILYLRSFLDDEVTGKIGSTMVTEEEQINKAFSHIGPMIAIGRPGEALPEVGAARAYFTDDKWQAAVHHYMEISSLVVLRAGLSQGLIWEIQNSTQRLDPSKLVLLIPFEKDAYDEFRVRVQSLFPKPLPEHPGHNTHRSTENKMKYGSLLGLIYFDKDWTGHFVKITADYAPYEFQMIGSPYAAEIMYLMLHYALRPIYARLGLAWDNLRLPWQVL